MERDPMTFGAPVRYRIRNRVSGLLVPADRGAAYLTFDRYFDATGWITVQWRPQDFEIVEVPDGE